MFINDYRLKAGIPTRIARCFVTGRYRAYEAVSFDQSNNKFSKAD
jgi:hypothetical protein